MSNRLRIAVPMLVGVLTLVNSPSPARAGFPIVSGHGDTVSHVTDLPSGHALHDEMPGVAVGYHYHLFHIYWCNVWTYSGEYCLYIGDTYWLVGNDKKQAADRLAIPEDMLHLPANYRFPPGCLLIVVFVAVSTIWGMIRERNSPIARVQRLLKAPLYQEACEIAFSERGRLSDAVSSLVGRGVRKEKAEANMSLLKAYYKAIAPPPPPSPLSAPLYHEETPDNPWNITL